MNYTNSKSSSSNSNSTSMDMEKACPSVEAALPLVGQLVLGLLQVNTDVLACGSVCRDLKQAAASVPLPEPVVLKDAVFRWALLTTICFLACVCNALYGCSIAYKQEVCYGCAPELSYGSLLAQHLHHQQCYVRSCSCTASRLP